ncbi:hypothetical protein VPHK406_0040 [Vibrio phage K406]
MRIDLSEDTMDIVMAIVRKHGLRLQDSVEFIINHPEEIEITRGELYDKKGYEKGTRKFKEN